MDAANKKVAMRIASIYLKEAGYSEELQKGIKVEKEHSDVYKFFEKFLKEKNVEMPITLDEFAEMVAKAHIKEMSDYYTKLAKIEGDTHKEAMDFSGIRNLIAPGKKLTDREIARAIRLSISAEHDATHLYELIADATNNQDVKSVMQHVADEEKVHVGEFMELLKKFDLDDEKFLEEGTKEVEEELGNKNEK